MDFCAACKQVNYCDKTCQKQHWRAHKVICLKKKSEDPKENKKDLMGVHLHHSELSGKKPSFYTRLSSIKPITLTAATCTQARAFTVTNERGQDKVIALLQKLKGEGEVFIGTSCLASLDLASVQENVNYIIVMDVSKVTRIFWKNATPLIRESTSREDCAQRIIKDLEKNIDVYYPKMQRYGFPMTTYISLVARKLQEPASFLSDKDRFEKIKKIFDLNHFVFLHLDLADTGACREIRNHLNKLKLKITNTIYLSNIIEFILPADLDNYGKSLELLATETSIVIDATETSFITTKRISALFSKTHLEEIYGFHQIYGNSPSRYSTMRLRERSGQSMETMYPLIGLQRRCKKPENLFYDYGIEQGYYTEKDERELTERVGKELGQKGDSSLFPEDIVRITMKHITQKLN
jgi:MYND finger